MTYGPWLPTCVPFWVRVGRKAVCAGLLVDSVRFAL